MPEGKNQRPASGPLAARWLEKRHITLILNDFQKR
jgi:hypothetical protein